MARIEERTGFCIGCQRRVNLAKDDLPTCPVCLSPLVMDETEEECREREDRFFRNTITPERRKKIDAIKERGVVRY